MAYVMLPSEAEIYVQTIKPPSIENLGTKPWIEWHHRLSKLSQQALYEASSMIEESVKETFVSYGKVSSLIEEAISINVWKNKVFPILLKLKPNPESTFIVYSILYHEAISVNLLELILFHGSVTETIQENAIDLLDYAYNAASKLFVIKKSEPNLNEKPREELSRQRNDLIFEIGLRSLTILRYLADFLDRLPLSVTSGMYKEYDVPVLLVEIMLLRPWIDAKKKKSYFSGRWLNWDGEVLNKTEAQVWLTLHSLLLNPLAMAHYPITQSRKTQLLKILPLMTDSLVDQIAILQQLKFYLCALSINNEQIAKPSKVIIESVPEIKNGIVKKYDGKWKSIAKKQINVLFQMDKNELMETAQSLQAVYDCSLFEEFEEKMAIGQNCAGCGKNSSLRCSRCKNRFYCSRKCQVEQWKHHKDQCKQD